MYPTQNLKTNFFVKSISYGLKQSMVFFQPTFTQFGNFTRSNFRIDSWRNDFDGQVNSINTFFMEQIPKKNHGVTVHQVEYLGGSSVTKNLHNFFSFCNF